MKRFAKLGLNSKVIKVHGVEDAVAPTEQAGIDFLKKLHDYPFWVQTFKGGLYDLRTGTHQGFTQHCGQPHRWYLHPRQWGELPLLRY